MSIKLDQKDYTDNVEVKTSILIPRKVLIYLEEQANAFNVTFPHTLRMILMKYSKEAVDCKYPIKEEKANVSSSSNNASV